MEGKGGKGKGRDREGKGKGKGRGREGEGKGRGREGKGRGRERGRGNSWLLYVVCMLLENNSSTHSHMYLTCISHIASYLLYVHHVHITFIAHLFVSRSQTWRRPSDSNR